MKLSVVFSILFLSSLAIAQTAGTPAPVVTPPVVAPTGLLPWLEANWSQVLVALLAIDAALIPLFPNEGFLVKLKNILSAVTPKT